MDRLFHSSIIFIILNFFVHDIKCDFRHIIKKSIKFVKLKIEVGPKRYQLFIQCPMVQWYTKFGSHLEFFFFFFWNIENQSVAGDVIQLNKKISLTFLR